MSNKRTAAAVRAFGILREILNAMVLGDSAVLQTVRVNSEEAQELLTMLQDARISVYPPRIAHPRKEQ